MNPVMYCQSCGLPLDSMELHGTEKDGSQSTDYCKYCYQEGAFTHPDMNLKDMADHLLKIMGKEKATADMVKTAVAKLSGLKRWKPRQKKKENTAIEQDIPSEKHPLERVPDPGPLVKSEDELDLIIEDDPRQVPGYETPEPGEGP